jgi:3-isopropylmalate/(R)-2-methylmalate dehydratase small subunit
MNRPESFPPVHSRAVVLDQPNVDTDQIIPARFIKRPRSEGFQNFLFYTLRRRPDGTMRDEFPLNRPDAAGARILIAGTNFGCGSSREGAVYALVDAGFRAIIAASFGDIFTDNALKNGLLPVVLPAPQVAALMATVRAQPEVTLAVDLRQQVVAGACLRCPFEIDPFAREALLNGVDEIGLTLMNVARVEAFEAIYQAKYPWRRIRVPEG